MSLVKPAAAGDAAAAGTALAPEFRDGLVWNVGASVYSAVSGQSEMFLRVGIGGSRVGDFRTVFTATTGEELVAVPIDNGASTTALRREISVGWNCIFVPQWNWRTSTRFCSTRCSTSSLRFAATIATSSKVTWTPIPPRPRAWYGHRRRIHRRNTSDLGLRLRRGGSRAGNDARSAARNRLRDHQAPAAARGRSPRGC